MSFRFPPVFPLISDWSVGHNGKHPISVLSQFTVCSLQSANVILIFCLTVHRISELLTCLLAEILPLIPIPPTRTDKFLYLLQNIPTFQLQNAPTQPANNIPISGSTKCSLSYMSYIKEKYVKESMINEQYQAINHAYKSCQKAILTIFLHFFEK